MQKYQRFMVDVVALTEEMSRLRGKTVGGSIELNHKLFQELMMRAGSALAGFNADLTFKTEQEKQRLRTRLKLDIQPQVKENPDADVQQEGQDNTP